jgi:two-component system NtrC family sensor kinase
VKVLKTVFIGGGQGCREVMQMVEQGWLGYLRLEILAVADIRADAPCMQYARQQGIRTCSGIEEALTIPGIELVIELTGSEEMLKEVNRLVPHDVRVIDHDIARVFWDLEKASRNLRRELREKTELQSQLARDRAELQEVLDAESATVVLLDREMRIRRVNRRFEQLTGISRDEARGLRWEEVMPDSDDGGLATAFAIPIGGVIENGKPVTLVHCEVKSTGLEEHYKVTANPIFDGDGKLSRIVQTVTDITEQVMLKRETEESARRFDQIVKVIRGIVTIKDMEGRYQLVNPRGEKAYGISKDEMLGKTAAELFPKEVAEVIEANDQLALCEGGNHVAEEILTLGGKERVLISERFPLTDYRGAVTGLCLVGRDYSRRRQLQNELIQTERLAAIGKLAAGVAHELNNPLSGILAFSQDLLLEATEDDPNREDYELLVNETLRCRRIVRDLLEFSRQKAPERQRVQLSFIVSRVLPMVERQASFHNIKFALDLDDGLPDIHADPHQIQQVLLNLVINARDAMAACGTITIRGEAVEDNSAVALSVTDTGCGIPKDQLVEIFEPFYSTKGSRGHGLGLAAVQNVVEGHDGRIEVDSEVDSGTTFRVILPAAWF